jgi:hypothetical protein
VTNERLSSFAKVTGLKLIRNYSGIPIFVDSGVYGPPKFTACAFSMDQKRSYGWGNFPKYEKFHDNLFFDPQYLRRIYKRSVLNVSEGLLLFVEMMKHPKIFKNNIFLPPYLRRIRNWTLLDGFKTQLLLGKVQKVCKVHEKFMKS